MPMYKWSDLEKTAVTPRHTNAMAETVLGDMLMIQHMTFQGAPSEGQRQGATMHNHPEEQFLVIIEGTFHVHEEGVHGEGEWSDLGPGDVYWIPACSMHEMIVDGEGYFYQFKIRIPGHSVYTTEWEAGSEEEWNQLRDKYFEMRSKYKDVAPWVKD